MSLSIKCLSHCYRAGGSFASSKRFISLSAINLNCGIKNVAVIGGGIMGSGIAQVAAQSNYNVSIWDIDEKSVERCRKGIVSSVQRVAKKNFKDDSAAAEKYIHDVSARITFSTKTEEAIQNADLLIEAVVEDVELKKKLFAQLDSTASEDVIFCTNTSSILVSTIAEAVERRKTRFLGLHFFNPVPVMKLVEIISLPESDKQTVEKVSAWTKSIGKVPVHCKDVPGFIVNQLLAPYTANAMMILQRGDASAEDIDTAMKLGAGVPMGPLALADFTGLDTVKRIIDSLHAKREYSESFIKTPEILNRLVAENKLGVKTGEGFHKYNK